MNLKKYYKDLLSSDSELIALIGTDNITSAYSQEVKTFPLVIFEDTASRDTEFSDNLPEGTDATVRIHIFSKTVKGYPKAEAIADVVKRIFREAYWACTLNEETPDVQDNIKHRILDFTRAFYAL